MKKIIIAIISCTFFLSSYAQLEEKKDVELFESFKKDRELKAAFMRFDMAPFVKGTINFICDTVQQTVDVKELNRLIRRHVKIPRNGIVQKASESNNGYTQTYGVYKNDDAILYITFTLSQENGVLQEVDVETNR